MPIPSLPWSSRVLLELDLTEAPADPDPGDPLARFRSRGRRQLRPTLRALHEAGEDPRVAGLVIKVGGALPWALADELRAGLAAFTATGTPAIAWAESFADGTDLAAYTLATAAPSIWLQPGGTLSLLGVASEATFLRGALDKLGVEPEFEQRYEYKNAVDQLQRTGYTEAHREASQALVSSVFGHAVRRIASARGLDPDRVRALVDSGPRTAAEALQVGLVDRLGYRDQVYDAAREQAGEDATLLFADQWQPRRRPSLSRATRGRRGHVALVRAHGGIVSGRSRRGPMGRQLGSDTVAAELRAAGRDERARAVLLQVDSPGGSAVASEVIWRELVRLREAGRTVVVSMGAVAGSGGYYIACPAEVIVALPSTLTGSIGVFGGKLVSAGLLHRLGIGTDAVSEGERARMYSARRSFSEEERERLAAAIDTVYADFVAKVAEGRGRSVAEIEPLARGRVWTGADAHERGLVDVLGGLRDAVSIARERADLPDTAPVLPALRVPPLARLGRPRNSEDRRALQATLEPRLTDLSRALGGQSELLLRMPDLRLR